jgi:hypothetical protein
MFWRPRYFDEFVVYTLIDIMRVKRLFLVENTANHSPGLGGNDVLKLWDFPGQSHE